MVSVRNSSGAFGQVTLRIAWILLTPCSVLGLKVEIYTLWRVLLNWKLYPFRLYCGLDMSWRKWLNTLSCWKSSYHDVVVGLVATIFSYSTPWRGKGLPQRGGQLSWFFLSFDRLTQFDTMGYFGLCLRIDLLMVRCRLELRFRVGASSSIVQMKDEFPHYVQWVKSTNVGPWFIMLGC